MEDDKKAKAKRPAGSESRETLHEYVGGVISNPITSDSPDEAERRGGSGTVSRSEDTSSSSFAGTKSKETNDTTTGSGGS